MAVTREVTVWCDRCEAWTYGSGQPARTVADARKGARTLGWSSTGGVDLCPTCRSEADAILAKHGKRLVEG